MDGQKLFNEGFAGGKARFDLLATLVSGLFDLAQRDRRSSQLLTDGTAEEAILVEHPDDSQISRVITDHDLFLDVACQRWVHVAISLKADTILLHTASFGHC